MIIFLIIAIIYLFIGFVQTALIDRFNPYFFDDDAYTYRYGERFTTIVGWPFITVGLIIILICFLLKTIYNLIVGR